MPIFTYESEPIGTTSLNICNMALTILGQDEITSIATGSSATKAQRLAYHWYAAQRNLFLQEAPWQWAMRRAELTEDTVASAAISHGWDYAFDLPSNFFKLWGLAPTDEALKIDSWDLVFVMHNDHILTNQNELWAVYLELDPADPEAYFEVDFSSALSWRLASIWNVPLTGKVNHQQHYERQAINALSRAISHNEAHLQPLEHVRETFSEARMRVT